MGFGHTNIDPCGFEVGDKIMSIRSFMNGDLKVEVRRVKTITPKNIVLQGIVDSIYRGSLKDWILFTEDSYKDSKKKVEEINDKIHVLKEEGWNLFKEDN